MQSGIPIYAFYMTAPRTIILNRRKLDVENDKSEELPYFYSPLQRRCLGLEAANRSVFTQTSKVQKVSLTPN